MIHRLETTKLRNVAKFFAHLLQTDALAWSVFDYIRLNEDETTSSSRIFIKILCQELSEGMGMKKLKVVLLAFPPFVRPSFDNLTVILSSDNRDLLSFDNLPSPPGPF